MTAIEEAIKLIEKARAKGEDKYQVLYETGGFDTSKYHLVCSEDIDQALDKLREKPKPTPELEKSGFKVPVGTVFVPCSFRGETPISSSDCKAPKPTEFTKDCRRILRRCDMPRRIEAEARGSDIWSNVIWEKLDKTCAIIERQASELKAKDELLFAYESVNAPINPLLAENKELKAKIDKLVEGQQAKTKAGS